jgi:hypothetical protein
MTEQHEDQKLQEEIRSLVVEAAGDQEEGFPLGRMQIHIASEAGGELHDPQEVLRQVSELVLGGLEISSDQGAARRISFDGGQLARAFSDSHAPLKAAFGTQAAGLSPR